MHSRIVGRTSKRRSTPHLPHVYYGGSGSCRMYVGLIWWVSYISQAIFTIPSKHMHSVIVLRASITAFRSTSPAYTFIAHMPLLDPVPLDWCQRPRRCSVSTSSKRMSLKRRYNCYASPSSLSSDTVCVAPSSSLSSSFSTMDGPYVASTLSSITNDPSAVSMPTTRLTRSGEPWD